MCLDSQLMSRDTLYQEIYYVLLSCLHVFLSFLESLTLMSAWFFTRSQFMEISWKKEFANYLVVVIYTTRAHCELVVQGHAHIAKFQERKN